MASCTLCRKSFKTDEALRQHTENSPAHTLVHCDACNKNFPHAEALAQHIRDSPAHRDAYTCEPCQRSFSSEESLNQHLQTSSAHAISHTCTLCDRSFTSESALQQHSRDSPAHAHASHPCPHCPRSFGSAAALAQHVRDSPTHNSAQPPRDTPLDSFFRAYEAAAGFPYDRAALPSESFDQLRRYMGWGGRERRDAWDEYVAALRQELDVWFGAEDDLANWHALCRAVGITPAPETCGGCAKALRGRHVNLVDLLQWAREGGTDEGKEEEEEGRRETVMVFKSVGELRRYCYKENKVFPLDEVDQAGEAEDGNVVIRHLLRRFRPSLKGRTDSVVGFLKY